MYARRYKGGKKMIDVSEKARAELKNLITKYTDMPQGRLRLMDRGHGALGLDLDIETPNDELFEYDGSTVLVVERGLAESLNGVTLGIEDSLEGSKLVIIYTHKLQPMEQH